ncbi:hypothetical protein ACSL103130_09055 [Actinomyces slackii]|uniref:ABC-2 family transporter protein n=1 Tax=Actinomyces slackii TaxID=52774 RepID=A0A3S5EM26_9ACTO|nr:hypothetical protein [Actinomyces slackii]VEG73797.1 ABC-2 family transporter protein [Actinomyces slackii]
MSPLTALVLRRERRGILGWALGGGALALYSSAMLAVMFSTAAERQSMVQGLGTPAAVVFTGPGFGLDAADPSPGALYAAQTLSWLGIVAAMMGVLMAVARTRGDEESGPGELLRAAPVARMAGARAALACVTACALVMGALTVVGAVAGGLEVAGSLAVGLGLALVALIGGGVGLVLGAVAPSARAARGTGLLVVLTWFLLRGMGDAGDASWLSWLSPIGLLQQSRAYVELRWEPLALLAGAGAVLAVVGLALHARRELGEGLVAGGAGRDRGRGPAGVGALAARTSAAARRWWLVGGLAFGGVYGAFAPTIESSFQEMLQDNPAAQAFFGEELGVASYLALIVGYGGMVAAAGAIALAAGAVGEEERGAAATVLSGPVSRRRWMAGRALVVLRGAVGIMIGAGVGLVGAAVPALIAADSPAVRQPEVLALGVLAGLVAQVPVALAAGALVLAVHAARPRLARPVGWGAFTAAVTLQVMGPAVMAPQWLLNLSPFAHAPMLPLPSAGTDAAGADAAGAAGTLWEQVVGPVEDWAGPGACLVVAALLMVVALAAVERRDLEG